ncbi:MAG: tripartite tricarboxylate transporter substrate binding protein [Betaproteobacteria bacterium]|nr:tripartite tricarboxylate transporter substrate binding protein [Betaproteobacteria bacterium]
MVSPIQVAVIIGMAFGALACPPTFAQGYPAKPLRMIIPFPAGGTADIIARLVSQKFAERIGQPVIAENRVGAGGTIGSDLVAKAAPDGYTFLMTTTGTHLLTSLVTRNVPYDPLKDFTPITGATESYSGLAVAPSSGINNVRELLDLARKNPGKHTYSSAGIGTAFHLTGALFGAAGNVELTHIPYKGAGQALTDLMSGTITMTFSAITSQLPFIRSGKLKLIAVMGTKRFGAFPEVPTVSEALPNFENLEAMTGFLGPASLPVPLLNRLNSELAAAVLSPEVRTKLEADGNTPVGNTPEQFAAHLQRSHLSYVRAVKLAGLKPE